MYLVIGLSALYIAFQVWAVRTYLAFIDAHPEEEARLIRRAFRQGD